MAADRRGARLGVLAIVGVLLFGLIGTRLWFLQTVEQESLQEQVDSTKLRRVPLLPERGRIFDADGRILADNERVLTVAVVTGAPTHAGKALAVVQRECSDIACADLEKDRLRGAALDDIDECAHQCSSKACSPEPRRNCDVCDLSLATHTQAQDDAPYLGVNQDDTVGVRDPRPDLIVVLSATDRTHQEVSDGRHVISFRCANHGLGTLLVIGATLRTRTRARSCRSQVSNRVVHWFRSSPG